MGPELLTEEDIADLKRDQMQAARLRAICGEDELLRQRIETFSRQAKFAKEPQKMDIFLQILQDVSSSTSRSPEGTADTIERPLKIRRAPSVDTNIRCFSTGALYTDSLLGIGVYRKGKNLGTAGELLSHEAYQNGLRQSTDKTPFEFFLPMWINKSHAASNAAWSRVLCDSYLKIGEKVYNTQGDDAAILEVFPRLINQLIVEMMRPDQEKTEAIATFEALCNCWRTLRWLLDTRASLRDSVRRTLTAFVEKEEARHKDTSPDLGVVLVLFTVLQGCEGCPARKAFVDAYADESFACSSSCCQPLSLVMMWMTRCKRSRRRIAKSPSDWNFFKAGGVSRKHRRAPGSCFLNASELRFHLSRQQIFGLLIVCSDLLPKDLSMSELRRAREKVAKVRARGRASGRASCGISEVIQFTQVYLVCTGTLFFEAAVHQKFVMTRPTL